MIRASLFGPYAWAKANARTNSGVTRTGQTASSGSSIFAESFTPHHQYCNYHNEGSKLSCRRAHQNNCPRDDRGKSFPVDKDGYCVNSKGMKFVQVGHEHKVAKFETPENPNDPVQKASEVTGTETTRLTTRIRKRQIHSKSKHKGLFENPDKTYNEFRDSQVGY